MDITFPAVVLHLVLLSHVHNHVQVVPHVVIPLDMPLKAVALGVKRKSVDAADEARVLHVLHHAQRVGTQLGKGVDDDTEDDVEQDSDHDCPVKERVEHLDPEVRVADEPLGHHRTNVAAAQALGSCGDKTDEQIVAIVVLKHRRVVARHRVAVEDGERWVRVLVERDHSDYGEEVDDDDAKEGGDQDRTAVRGHRLEHVLQVGIT
mmetsp:Transcript_5430/g.14203  ORF Transcript_5430/g.14203 Transcript_5430/m.14203 type:complete len:206 (-) Transcript_5430:318-935(-)